MEGNAPDDALMAGQGSDNGIDKETSRNIMFNSSGFTGVGGSV
jgi:hypothetical protein